MHAQQRDLPSRHHLPLFRYRQGSLPNLISPQVPDILYHSTPPEGHEFMVQQSRWKTWADDVRFAARTELHSGSGMEDILAQSRDREISQPLRAEKSTCYDLDRTRSFSGDELRSPSAVDRRDFRKRGNLPSGYIFPHPGISSRQSLPLIGGNLFFLSFFLPLLFPCSTAPDRLGQVPASAARILFFFFFSLDSCELNAERNSKVCQIRERHSPSTVTFTFTLHLTPSLPPPPPILPPRLFRLDRFPFHEPCML